MSEAYSKPRQKYLRWWGIFKTVYSDIFKRIQEHSPIFLFRHFQAYSGKFTNIQSCLGTIRGVRVWRGIFRHYWVVLSHTQLSSWLCVTLTCTTTIFRPLAYLERQVSSKACGTPKDIRYIQSPGIVPAVFSNISKVILEIFGVMNAYPAKLPQPWKLSGCAPTLRHYSFAKRFILNVW